MFGIKKELTEIQRPNPQKLVLRTSNTEPWWGRNCTNSWVMNPVNCIKLPCVIIYLIQQTSHSTHINLHRCDHLFYTSFSSLAKCFESHCSEMSVPGKFVEDNSAPWEMFSFDPPETDIFFSAGDKFEGLEWRELQLSDLKIWYLFGKYLKLILLLSSDFVKVQNNNAFSIVRVLSSNCNCFIVWGNGQAINLC